MTLPQVNRAEALGRLEHAIPRLTGLLREVEDPGAAAIGYWSVAEVAAHVSHVLASCAQMAEGAGSPIEDHRSIPAGWDRALAQDPERDLEVIAGRIEEAGASFGTRASAAPAGETVAWHGGIRIPMSSLAGLALNECTLHGRDIALAAGRPWPIAPEAARLIIDAHFPFLHHFVNESRARGLEATYELSVRGGSTVYIGVHGGALTIDTAPAAPDCRLSIEPVDYLLVGYGRRGRWGPILRGRIVAWGRKPWLGLRFATLFRTV